MAELPDDNVVGRAKINRRVIESSDWQAAKALDARAADRIIDLLWSSEKTELLQSKLKDPCGAFFIAVPSSSRTNMLAIRLAERISTAIGAEYANGNEFFRVTHPRQFKHIPRYQRAYHAREYVPVEPGRLRNVVSGRQVVVVEDVLSTGGSVAQFIRELNAEGVEVRAVAALMGDRRLNIDEKTRIQLESAINRAGLPVSASLLAERLTRQEAGNVIISINNARSDDAKQRIAENLQGILHRGTSKGLGGDQTPGGHSGLKGDDIGHGRPSEGVSAGGVSRGETREKGPGRVNEGDTSWGAIPFEISIKAGTTVFNREVYIDTQDLDMPQLKQLLCERADEFVQGIDRNNRENLRVTIRPVRNHGGRSLKELLKATSSIERSR